jgi:hypothetical protein
VIEWIIYQNGFTTLPPVLLQEQPAVVLLLERDLVSWSLAIDERGGHEDLRGSDRRSVIPYVHERMELYCSSLPCLCEPEPFSFPPTDLCEVVPARTFYISRSGSYNESWGPTGGLGAGQTLCCRVQQLGVANDVLYDVSSVESSCLIALLHWTWPVPWCRPVGSYHLCSHGVVSWTDAAL